MLAEDATLIYTQLIMTELNVNAENLNAENVESVKAQDDGTTVPVNGQPAIAPQADQNTPVPNQAQGE